MAVAAIVVHSFVDFNMHIPANALLVVTVMGLTVAMDNGTAGSRRPALPRGPRIGLAVMLLALAGAGVWFGIPLVRADRDTSLGNAYKEALEWDSRVDRVSQRHRGRSGIPRTACQGRRRVPLTERVGHRA